MSVCRGKSLWTLARLSGTVSLWGSSNLAFIGGCWTAQWAWVELARGITGGCWKLKLWMASVCVLVCLESVVHCWDIWLPPPGRKTVQYCRALPLLSLHTEMWQIFLALQHLTEVPAFNLIAKQANSSRGLWVLKIKLSSQQILVSCRNVQVV